MSFSTIEISLWLEQPRYDAIQRALKESDTDLENVMQGRLEEFYRQIVPGQERQRIDEAIETDRLAVERERIADQKISAFHIVENGQITVRWFCRLKAGGRFCDRLPVTPPRNAGRGVLGR